MAVMAQIFEPKSDRNEISFWTMKTTTGRMWQHPKLKDLDARDEAQCAVYEAPIMDGVKLPGASSELQPRRASSNHIYYSLR